MDKKQLPANIKSYRLALLVALFISLISGGLHFYRYLLLPKGANYTPLVTVGVDIHTVDEVFYAERIQRAASGSVLVGDRHFYEHRSDAYIFPTITPLIFGLVTRLLGHISWTFILADFVFPPITFLLLFYFLYKSTHAVLLSVTGAVTALFYDVFQEFIASVLRLSPAYFIKRMIIGDGRVLHMTRFEAQEFIFPSILIAIICLYLANEKKSFKLAILSGGIFGLHPYIYPYSTMFYGIGTFLLFGYSLMSRNKQTIKYSLVALISGLLLSIPYVITFIQFRQLTVAQDIIRRAGTIEYYSPNQILTQFGHYFLFVGLAFYVSRKNLVLRFASIYLLGVILALIFFPYGKTYHLDIYLKIWFPVVLFIFISELVKGSNAVKSPRMFRKTYLLSLLILFILILGGGAIKHLSSAIPSRGNFTIDRSIIESYGWIKRNTHPDSVILSPSLQTNRELPAYIPNFVFLGRGEFTYASTREIIERALLVYKYYGYSEADVASVFTGIDQHISTPFKAPYTHETIESLGTYYFLGQSGASIENLQNIFGSSEGLTALLTLYRQTPRLTMPEIAARYRINYLYFGPNEKRLTQYDPKQDSDLELEYEDRQVKVFQIRADFFGRQ